MGLAAVLGAISVAASAQAMPPELQKAWNATKLPESALSLEIREAGGPVITRVNVDTPRNPASVMKTVTTWSALSALGPDFSWRTRLMSNAGAQVDAQGTLQGPLYVVGGGDPWFTQEDLWGLLRQLRLRGVKNLSEVVVDRSRFGNVTIDPGEFDDSPTSPYNASPDAMMVSWGASRILFYPDTQTRQWIPIIDPPTRNIHVDGKVEWLDGRCTGSPSVMANIQTQDHQTTVHVGGKVAGACGEFSYYRLIGSQADHFDGLFRLLWQELGGTIAHGVTSGKAPSNAKMWVWHDSPPLTDVIRATNKVSNNVMARMIFLTLGAELKGPGATLASSGQAVLDVMKNQDVNTAGWVLVNGSGLSRQGRLTVRGLGQMYNHIWMSPLMPEFLASLSIAGVDGTTRKRLRAGDTRGQAHLKTGTLRNSRGLVGFVHSKSGKRYILVSLVNDPAAGAVRGFDDEIVRWLAAK
ncbi:MAG TPA: D-alanyl-D-alanine carboxypeptidase/D-alanyl-D-alanine-endopeptidase [Castellaniella sp.]|uniref:D-alanyl-D-alanine carboxypeptidase/D-alanyl-D-alanine endopeptidase n=1 Tax=Castellaniella sp. TaxID=1955812 RepID=UPI002EEB31F5